MSIRGGARCDRRAFVVRATGALATAVLPLACVPAALPVTPRNGVVRLDVGEHPGLAGPDGFLRVQPAGFANPVYLLTVADGGYVALSPICTHQGCTVGVQGARLVCPCHGSTYDRRGRVLRGPAPSPLRSFPVETEPDGTLRIALEGE